DDDVTGEELALDLAPLAALHLDEGLRGDADLAELLGHPHGLDPLLEVLADPLLEAGVGVDDVPVLLPGLHRASGRVHATTPAARKSRSITQDRPLSTRKR